LFGERRFERLLVFHDIVVYRGVLRQRLLDAKVILVHLRQIEQQVPLTHGDELGSGELDGLGRFSRAPQEEVPVGVVHFLLAELDFHGDYERVEEFVLFEEASANVLVEVDGDVVDQDQEPLLQHLAGLRLFESALEELHEELETVLVHGVDEREVGDREVQHAAALGDHAVVLAGLEDLFLRDLGLLHAAVHGGRGHF